MHAIAAGLSGYLYEVDCVAGIMRERRRSRQPSTAVGSVGASFAVASVLAATLIAPGGNAFSVRVGCPVRPVGGYGRASCNPALRARAPCRRGCVDYRPATTLLHQQRRMHLLWNYNGGDGRGIGGIRLVSSSLSPSYSCSRGQRQKQVCSLSHGESLIDTLPASRHADDTSPSRSSSIEIAASTTDFSEDPSDGTSKSTINSSSVAVAATSISSEVASNNQDGDSKRQPRLKFNDVRMFFLERGLSGEKTRSVLRVIRTDPKLENVAVLAAKMQVGGIAVLLSYHVSLFFSTRCSGVRMTVYCCVWEFQLPTGRSVLHHLE